jgi:hypothetical protein
MLLIGIRVPREKAINLAELFLITEFIESKKEGLPRKLDHTIEPHELLLGLR